MNSYRLKNLYIKECDARSEPLRERTRRDAMKRSQSVAYGLSFRAYAIA
ncbi:hypothetical protein [Moorena bouillonii]|nr:hypothetical protein [Moorena bouillonii]NEO44455.1 hypothetical protein [Moorena sp. SIO4A3]